MIKLIACDLDGTLLDEEKRLPEGIFPIIETLRRRGVLFVPASGRQYEGLRRLFRPVADDLLYLCENGALVKYRGETLLSEPVPRADVLRALGALGQERDLFPVLCCEDCAYFGQKAEPFFSLAAAAYPHLEQADLEKITQPVYKIAVYDAQKRDRCAALMHRALPALRTVPSGFGWCDISSPAANKGAALAYVQRRFALGREECVAFGDHMNDYEMLLCCGRAYVPESGYPYLKERFPRIPHSGKGVVEALQTLIQGDLS